VLVGFQISAPGLTCAARWKAPNTQRSALRSPGLAPTLEINEGEVKTGPEKTGSLQAEKKLMRYSRSLRPEA
jgi:hypothetical protein